MRATCLSGDLTAQARLAAVSASAFVYNDERGGAFQALGVKGKVGSDNVPVRGEVFTRPQALGGKRDMHIYVAF